MRRLAVLQLGTANDFNTLYFTEQLAIKTINTLLPVVLHKAGLHDHAESCSNASTLAEARKAANYAAKAANYADATYAVDVANAVIVSQDSRGHID
jgi:hypothetical protein